MVLIEAIILLPFVCGLIVYEAQRKEKDPGKAAVLVTAGIFVLAAILLFVRPFGELFGSLSIPLSFYADGFHLTYALIAAFMWLFTTLFAREYFAHEEEPLGRYWMFILFTLGATEGVMLSADFLTAFVFFEILSFTSFTWVIQEETKEAVTAAYTYLFLAVLGGMILFFGLALLQHTAGTLRFSELPLAVQNAGDQKAILAAAVCILLGFGAKAGMFPLHVWLPMAHPVAPSPASALLSGILTKVGIYGILMTALYVLPDSAPFGIVILSLAVITLFLGALLALVSRNLKRTLACSSMSQIGFILSGIAMMVLLKSAGHEDAATLALCGVFLHMVNHSLIKLVLFESAGVVVMRLHALTLSQIRGFGRNKLPLKLAFLSGALGISGVPLFCGYLSKTLLHEGITEGIHLLGASYTVFLKCCEILFLVGGGLTFAYMLRLFICLFVEKNEDGERQEAFDAEKTCMNKLTAATLLLPALFMPLLGQPPLASFVAGFMTDESISLTYEELFGAKALKGGGISLLCGALVYVILVRGILEKRKQKQPDGTAEVFLLIGRGFLKLIAGLFRILDRILDGPLFLAWHRILREQEKEDRHTQVYGFFGGALTGKADPYNPIISSFSFALMMTCIGILLILFVLVFKLL